MQIGRNELCPCGSGKKAKRCCGVRNQGFFGTHGPAAVVAIVLAIGASAILAALKRDNTAPRQTEASAPPIAAPTTTAAAQPAASTPPTANAATATVAAPPGPAPAGKAWSPEHGHWHNAPTGQSPVRIDMAGGASPQVRVDASSAAPTGEVAPSPGMIWSAEHNHWHFPESDSQISNMRVFPRGKPPARESTPRPQPPGPVPDGMEWSAEHGHWHKKGAAATSTTGSKP